MDKIRLGIVLMIISFCSSFQVMAERDDCDFSTSYDVGISKKFFKRLQVGFTESVSLNQNSTNLDKISSKVDVSYAVVRKIFKVGVSYYAISKHREENYFFNQRFQGYTNVKYTFNRFTLAWRSRYQMTYRPEKEEPKVWSNYWRNKNSTLKVVLELAFSRLFYLKLIRKILAFTAIVKTVFKSYVFVPYFTIFARLKNSVVDII